MIKCDDKNLNITAKQKSRRAFSLVEIITVTLISSMVMISTLAIFNQVRKATASINARLDKEDIVDEILQRIAEDLDRLAAPGFDTKLTIKNKVSNGHNKSQLIIENKIYDKSNKPRTFEKIVWQSEYDIVDKRLILYRHHSGLSLEDKILDGELEEIQSGRTELFIPISDEMTVFEILVPRKNANPLTQWTSTSLPLSVVVKISSAAPVENIDGTFEVLEEDWVIRNIAIDRTRKQKFVFQKKDFSRPEPDEDADPNDIDSETVTDDKKDSINKLDKKSDDKKIREKALDKANSIKPK
ncbi:MAG: hypothetical protein FVQ82_03635 [Planctomycetes bacterium]|nr:hypothetical protein [Planctomycetota bacterium]